MALAACLFASCAGESMPQQKPTHTCTQVSVIRANGADGVLWLPVQETIGEATIRVISDNVLQEELFVRLACDSIDYFVPYELSRFGNKDLVFEIRTWLPDTIRRERMACWKAITTGDANLYPVPAEHYRSDFHHTPLRGWMNDPNGMFYDEQTRLWHLYYQHNPYGAMWGNMHWAHSTSADLIHWKHEPMALRPTSLGAIFSGSAVIDRTNAAGFAENTIVALYTAAGQSQKQAVAYSLDHGQSFTHYAANPVLCDTIADFRDPKVFWDKTTNRWVMVLACQQEMRFYASDNLKDWTYLSRFGEDYGCHDGVWECPDLFELPVTDQAGNSSSLWVLLCNINPGGPFGGSATQYFVGTWDGTAFTCVDEPKKQKWLDYRKDHYATVTFHNAPDNRVVALGWMSNWQYANQLPTLQFRSQNTIARDLSLYVDDCGEYRVAVVPSKENEALRGEVTDAPKAACVIDVDVPASNKTAVITLANDLGEQVVMCYDFSQKTFSMDRQNAGNKSFSNDFACTTTTPLFLTRDTYRLTLFIDRCSIEAFDGNGAWAMTNLVFPTLPYNKLTVSNGTAIIYDLK